VRLLILERQGSFDQYLVPSRLRYGVSVTKVGISERDVCPRRLLTVARGTPRIMSQDAKVWRGGHGSGNPSVLSPHRPVQSQVSRHPTDSRGNRGTFPFPILREFIMFSLHC
jgi:hypothetical protein